MSTKNQSISRLLDLKNKSFEKIQNSKIAKYLSDSLIFKYIDNLSYAALIATLVSTAFLSSAYIAFFALLFCFFCLFKLVTKKGEQIKISKADAILVVYFCIVLVSLFGSSLFILSLKGFLKTYLYFMFYFFAVYFFMGNKRKIIPTLFVIASLVSFESIVAFIQNYTKIEAIAGWQDTSYLSDTNQLISRAYGTLKPYNPNLLAGYLLAGMSSLFAFAGIYLAHKNKKRFLIYTALLIVSTIAIIYTGCRGAYIGLIAFFGPLIWGLVYCAKKYFGGLSNIKKRYKNLILTIIGAILAFIALTPSVLNRFTSIFAFRADSSISFRMNVYEASIRMFQDNPFLGIGVGNQNFRETYGLYMKTGFDALGAYSIPLEIAIESGIFALIAFVLFISYLLKKALFITKDRCYPLAERVLIFSIMLMIISTMAHGLFDTVWYRPNIQIIFWINAAILNVYILCDKNIEPKDI